MKNCWHGADPFRQPPRLSPGAPTCQQFCTSNPPLSAAKEKAALRRLFLAESEGFEPSVSF